VVTHAARTWLGARRDHAERDAELIDLVRVSVRDHFQRRTLVRQLEDLAESDRRADATELRARVPQCGGK
jgi:hypothetical protein